MRYYSEAARLKVPKLSFAAQVIASLIAGAICGLFLGEEAQILAPIWTIFIKLMQVRPTYSCNLYHHRYRQH
jgi:Na+/H+-dicarboxylate symporter